MIPDQGPSPDHGPVGFVLKTHGFGSLGFSTEHGVNPAARRDAAQAITLMQYIDMAARLPSTSRVVHYATWFVSQDVG